MKMKFLQGLFFFSSKLQRNNACTRAWNQRSFQTQFCLNQIKFDQKSAKFKKFKLKQAAMQKDDDVPVFLKKGLPDKILYNFTLGLLLFNILFVFKVFHTTDINYRR